MAAFSKMGSGLARASLSRQNSQILASLGGV
jgi:hypothetical protein